MSNFIKNQKTHYRKPSPLQKDWNYVGDGRLHDPTTNDPKMKGRKWTMDMSSDDNKTFSKLNNERQIG